MTPSDSDRCPNCFATIAGTPCPGCGWRTGLDNPPPALALGTLLDGRYRIGRVLGHGGFGITYLTWDENLHLRLAIKEYLPRDSATRAPDGVSLSIYSGPAGEQFAYGLERFIEEARALARFDQHPGIVTVKNFFRAHGTGYCVMDYVEGITLRRYLEQQPEGKTSVEAAWKLLMPVMDALRAVHQESLLHRDIAPDNIYVTQDGRVKLLDFGAARYAAGEHSKSLSIILKPGYTPEEQYRSRGRQGPWTDVYGLAATFYRAITGIVPPEALDRMEEDELVPPSRLGVAIRPGQESVLLKALAVKSGQRFQSITELQQAWLSGDSPATQSSAKDSGVIATPPSITAAPSHHAESKVHTGNRWGVSVALLVVVLLGLIGYWQMQPGSSSVPKPRYSYSDQSVSPPAVQGSYKPPSRAVTSGPEPNRWHADWGSGIHARARLLPCPVNEFLSQGYRYTLSVDIPVGRLKKPSDAWAIANGRAQTIQGCWFDKGDGFVHVKMRRKKDNKTWEQDLNFGDGSWFASVE